MRTAVFALVVCGLMAVLATPAHAADGVSCGAVITQDTVLTHDLVCSGDGLSIEPGDAGVTLDLGGHTVSGDGTGTGIWADGLHVTGRVTVRHGRIVGFHDGVSVQFASVSIEHVTVDRAAETRTGTGIGLDGGQGSLLDAIDVRGFENAIEPRVSVGTRLLGSTLHGNATGVYLSSSSHALTIDQSVISDGDIGLYLSQSAVTVRYSSILRMQGPAVQLGQSEARITDSVLAQSGAGVAIPSDESGLDLRRSIVVDNGVGVNVGSDQSAYASLWYLQVHDNWFIANRGPGLAFGPWMRRANGFDPWEIRRNRFIGNGGDGVDIDARGTAEENLTFADNVAEGNAGQGFVTAGVVDGGGNRARSNGGEPQCVGVSCS
jgi:hypothetical protein